MSRRPLSRWRVPGLALLALLGLAEAHAVEIQRWERIPLAIPLVVGQERIVFVDRNVRVGLPRSLDGKLRVQSTGGALYLLAQAPIEPSRLQLQDAATGEILLVDIAAAPPAQGQAPLEPVRIVPGEAAPKHYGRDRSVPSRSVAERPEATRESDNEDEPTPPRRETPIPVVLTRYAAQMLYAPLRTVEPVEGIAPVKLDRRLELAHLLPGLPVEASALGAWRLDDHWVTAVKLRNRSAQRLALDPRELLGDFATATFQHPDLGRRGDASDTTVLYLVTKGHGLERALIPALGAADPRPAPEDRDGHAQR